jgi:hypothetical protein
VAVHLALEDRGDRQRRGVEGQRLAEHLDPAHPLVALGHLPAGQALLELLGAAQAVGEAFGALGLGLDDGGELAELGVEGVHRLMEGLVVFELGVAEAGVVGGDGEAQVAGGLFELAGGLDEGEAVAGGGDGLGAGVAGELEELGGGHALAEEQAGGFGQLVGFVEDHRVARGQQLAHAAVAQLTSAKKRW